MIKKIKNFIRKFTLETPKLLEGVKNNLELNDFSSELPNLLEKIKNNPELKNLSLNFKTFGNLNENKIFYVIKRSPGTGLFSNVTFVLNHLKICEKNNFIPIIDMENFKTIYNELGKIKNTYNSWEYYFQKISDYSLNDVYKSKNVIITNDKFFHFFSYSIDLDSELVSLLQNKIKINNILYKTYKKISKKFDKKKILGIHFRGTSYKRSPGHPLPATKKQMFKITNKIIKEEKIDKIFLVTEEQNYLKYFKKKFPDKIINIDCCYRSDKNDAFKIYPRERHRYKLGREALIETLLLSKCDFFIYLCSNISSAAISFNLNHEQKKIEIKNGMNSKNIIISQYLWYLKTFLPKKLGGL